MTEMAPSALQPCLQPHHPPASVAARGEAFLKLSRGHHSPWHKPNTHSAGLDRDGVQTCL